ncbi:MAG: succinylglutamate desuccinylase/aspartoacylase family protein [Planctomycetota bacterium]|nr:succinylglutamate desuccinylase/aspartoacylase family protein [Planctomycetota bacterium]MDA1113852.1 succinylglutamate desuccinylase/aspartoacylase family protein [Planctomycetota bacterium]
MSKAIPRIPAWQWPDGFAAPGEHLNVAILAAHGFADYQISIPVHIWRGLKPGPAVFITGALHGDEINGTGAIREIILNPNFELDSGTLVLVPVLNIPGFERHSRYLPDRRDLNRSFPGNDSGSMASRLAHIIFSEIIGRCDYGIDIHTAAVRRTNFPNVRADLSNPEVKRLANAFGAELLVDTIGPKGAMRREACESGCPTILLEAGEVWKVEPTVVEIALRGVRNVLQELGMVAGQPEKPAFRIVAKRTKWIRAESGGFLRFHASPGDLVEKDQLLATNTSLLGQEQSTIISPMDGVILGMTTLPSVAPGDPVCHVAKLRQPIERLERTVEALDDDTLHERLRADLGSNLLIDEPNEVD